MEGHPRNVLAIITTSAENEVKGQILLLTLYTIVIVLTVSTYYLYN